MAQIYKCEDCGDELSIPDKRVIYGAYCNGEGNHYTSKMTKVSDRLAERAVKVAERILREARGE